MVGTGVCVCVASRHLGFVFFGVGGWRSLLDRAVMSSNARLKIPINWSIPNVFSPNGTGIFPKICMNDGAIFFGYVPGKPRKALFLRQNFAGF